MGMCIGCGSVAVSVTQTPCPLRGRSETPRNIQAKEAGTSSCRWSVAELQPLEAYDIDPELGFVTREHPLPRLPAAFEPWEVAMDALQAEADSTGRCGSEALRAIIFELPVLDAHQLKTKREHQRGFQVMGMLGNAYVWGAAVAPAGQPQPPPVKILDELPPGIAVPWIALSQILGIEPVFSYAPSVLWNWRMRDEKHGFQITNLVALNTFTGTPSESYFYTVTLAIEATGAKALPALLSAVRASQAHDANRTAELLETVADGIFDIGDVMAEMHNHCNPAVFNDRVRRYLAGWEGMDDLPHGVRYLGAKDEQGENYRRYAGGSAGQSALIHTFDIALGLEHRHSGQCPIAHGPLTSQDQPTPSKSYLSRMRYYMPGPHRQLLEDLEACTQIRALAMDAHNKPSATPGEKQLLAVYNRCVMGLKRFRDIHFRIVTKYIIIQQNRRKNVLKPGMILRGAGGTALVPFLKQTRDETNAAVINS
ncbi:Indoleamine 2,3-dioxygenase [Powellomyces hirtus]|nr:Indoleamine 2,3-dioxygenase [Powellomyces hirtus]